MSDDLLAQVQDGDALQQQIARDDPNTFIEYVIRDERTGQPLVQAPVHEAWHELASEYDRLLIWAAIEHGKSTQLSISRPMWELGRNPSLRVAVVSNTHNQAVKIVRTIARYVELSSELRRVFPKLLPGKPWTDESITVQRPFTSKDPSIQACGVHGNILGSRIDLLILDDVLDYENCRTELLRKELWDWYTATLSGRLTAKARVLVVGTAFHPEDLLHRLAKHVSWRAMRFPVLDPNTGQSRWPEAWPLERIAAKRVEMGPLEFARQMLCVARDDSEARFKREWIERCLMRGRGKQLCYGLQTLPNGFSTYTGVDLAVQRHDAAGLTVLFTIAVHRNGDRELLNIESGRWSGPEIVTRLHDAHRRYFSVVMVENNAAQDFILQFARGASAIPIRAFTTGRNKAHPEFGVESIATEMCNGKWIIPSGDGQLHPEVDAWVQEMLYYDPKGHTGDRLMASWFSREAARQGAVKVESTFIDLMTR